MPVYQVKLTYLYLITVEGEIDCETAVVAATNVVKEHPEIYSDVEIEEVEETKNLSEKMNFDNIILPEFDEDNPDVECVYQVWKKIVEDYSKGEK